MRTKMPDIAINHSTFERLQRHAKPLVDSVDSVIHRALDALEKQEAFKASNNGNGGVLPSRERIVSGLALPDLTHTRVLEATIEGNPVRKPNWNGLLDEMVRLAMTRIGDFEKVRRLSGVNMVSGYKDDEGFGYLSDLDVSIQGQDANAACRAIAYLADALGISIEIGFMWRLKEGAAFPGERGRLKLDKPKQPQTRSP
jgi:hypothetical protein